MTVTVLLDQQRAVAHDLTMANYRALIREAAAVEEIPPDLLASLNELADALGFDSDKVSRHVGAIRSHLQVTAKLPDLEKTLVDADRLAKVAALELKTLNEKVQKARQRVAAAAAARQNLSAARTRLEGYELKHPEIFSGASNES
jgi:ParB-like chromosome segregation protein Spo0J